MAGPRWMGACALGVIMALIAAPAALGGTASVVIGDGSATLVYLAAAGERNNVAIGRDPASGAYRVVEGGGKPVAVIAGEGCEPSSFGQVLCTLPQELAHVANVDLGDRDDGVFIDLADGLSVTARGGTGRDSIVGPGNAGGGAQFWEIFTGDSPPRSRLLPAGHQGSASSTSATLSGGPGADSLEGGAGSDMLLPGPGQDWIKGSAGDDHVVARDGAVDMIKCDGGRDRVELDRVDFVYGECGEISSRKVTSAFPVGAHSENPDEGPLVGLGPLLAITVGCPSDGPAICQGDVKVRGGPAIVGRRFRVRRGHVKHALLFPNFRFVYKERSQLIVRSRDAAGRSWAVSRLFNLELPRYNPD